VKGRQKKKPSEKPLFGIKGTGGGVVSEATGGRSFADTGRERRPGRGESMVQKSMKSNHPRRGKELLNPAGARITSKGPREPERRGKDRASESVV